MICMKIKDTVMKPTSSSARSKQDYFCNHCLKIDEHFLPTAMKRNY